VKRNSKNSITVNGVKAEAELKIETGDENEIKLKLSDGNNQLVNILPDRALEIITEILGSEDAALSLKEVEEGEQLRAVYVGEVAFTGQLLGLFDVKLDLSTTIDPETAEVIDLERPFWFFLVTGLVEEPTPEINETVEEPLPIENVTEPVPTEPVVENVTEPVVEPTPVEPVPIETNATV